MTRSGGDGAHGRFVVIAGTDGAGKTTVADHVAGVLEPPAVLRLHHRPHVLGRTPTATGPVTEPHRDPPYPLPVSLGKVVFLFLDHLLGWWRVMRPHLRAGGSVVLERGWWDLAVDPRRYRLHPHPRLVRVLGWLLPRPTVTVVLVAEPAVLAARTTELDAAELGRQVAAWERLPGQLLRARRVDVAAPLPTVLAEVEAVVRTRGRAAAGWVALPSRRRTRWLLPRAPRRATTNALRIYTPVTPVGLVGWLVARTAARAGLARLLPRAEPAVETLRATADLVPPGGTVAIAFGSHPDRHVQLVLDRRGRPSRFVKVGDDATAATAIRAEADTLERLRPLLPGGLAAPAVLVRDDTRVAYDALRWSPRLRPWVLPPEVAYALGRFTGSTTGPAHGDCAPWNLLRTHAGWYLVDWADARDDAPAFTDPWHYIVQAHALLGRPSRVEVVAGVDDDGWVGTALRSYCEGAGLHPSAARPALLDYLHATIPQMDADRDDGRRGLAARRALLRALDGEEPA